jgi:hypothetical protein
MPYYVYKIFEAPIRHLKMVEQHESFRSASNQAKLLRSEYSGEPPCVFKVIFAETELHAEDLLNQVREAKPGPGDD